MAVNSAFCRWLLWCCILISGHDNLSSTASKEETDQCSVSNGVNVSFYNCAKDCSQPDFNCSIGGLEEVERYQHTKNRLYKFAAGLLDPPHLLDVRYQMVYVTDTDGGSTKRDVTGSIYIQFRLPKALDGVFPGAVQLYFQGINENDYYFRCPRQRIFEFHNYNPESSYYSLYPRNISYNCFYGVDSLHERSNYASDYRTKFKKGFTLGLKSHPGRWINYTITINTISPIIPVNQWIPTVAFSLNVTKRSLIVLVEKESDRIQVIYAYAYLKLPNGVLHRSVQLIDREGLFANLTHGRFVITVNITGLYNGTQMYWSAETLEIDATEIPKAYPLHYADLNMGSVKIISVVLGCSIGVALLLLFGVVVYRRREWKKIVYCYRKTSGIVLHPFDKQSSPELFKFVECYEKFVENYCSCSLIPWKRLRSKSSSKLRTWLENDFRSLSFIIVFYNRSDFNRNEANIDLYYMVLQEVDKQRKFDSSQIIVIPIKMPGSARPPTLINQISDVNWDDFDNLYCKIHCEIQTPTSKRDILMDKWRSTDVGKSLMGKFGNLKLERNIETCRQSELGEDHSEGSEIVNNNQRSERIEEKQPDVEQNIVDYAESVDMKKFALDLNIENDSVIGEICKKKRNVREDFLKERSKSREYDTQTSIHSIQADVHSDSFSETVLSYLTDSKFQKETTTEREMDLRQSDKSHSLSASNGSNYSNRSQCIKTGQSYKDGITGNQNMSPQNERRQNYYSGVPTDSLGQQKQNKYFDYMPYQPDESTFYLEKPNNRDCYSQDHRNPYHQHYPDPPYNPLYHHQGGQHYGEYDHEPEYPEHHPLMNDCFHDYPSHPDHGSHYHVRNFMNKPEVYLPPHTTSPPSMYMPSNFYDMCTEINRNPVNQYKNHDMQSNRPYLHSCIEPEPETEIPVIKNPCLIIKRKPNHTETVNQELAFRAHDLQPPEDEYRSRSRTTEGLFPRYSSAGELELEEMKSVSQDFDDVRFIPPEDGFVSPAHSNHSSRESILSQDQVAELLNINNSALTRNSFH